MQLSRNRMNPLRAFGHALVCREPYFVIAPPSGEAGTDAELLTSHPFIWFSPKTWAGHQIKRMLSRRKIYVRDVMEANSLEGYRVSGSAWSRSLYCSEKGMCPALR